MCFVWLSYQIFYKILSGFSFESLFAQTLLIHRHYDVGDAIFIWVALRESLISNPLLFFLCSSRWKDLIYILAIGTMYSSWDFSGFVYVKDESKYAWFPRFIVHSDSLWRHRLTARTGYPKFLCFVKGWKNFFNYFFF